GVGRGDVQHLSVDGVLVPPAGEGWRGAKPMTIGDVVSEAGAAGRTTNPSYFARMTDHETFGRQALGELGRRGTFGVAPVAAAAAGAGRGQDLVGLRRPGAGRGVGSAPPGGHPGPRPRG